jgi:hypothetical protein
MALVGGRQVQVEEIGKRTNIPENPTARIMYYLRCVKTTTSLDIPDRLVNFNKWNNLSPQETALVFLLAVRFSPQVMARSWRHVFGMTQVESVPPGSRNRFFEVTDRQVAAFANEEVIVAGQRVRVKQGQSFTRPIGLETSMSIQFVNMAKCLTNTAATSLLWGNLPRVVGSVAACFSKPQIHCNLWYLLNQRQLLKNTAHISMGQRLLAWKMFSHNRGEGTLVLNSRIITSGSFPSRHAQSENLLGFANKRAN